MEKKVRLHYGDEIIEQDFSLTSFIAYNTSGMIFIHESKEFVLYKKAIRINENAEIIELFLKRQ